KSLAIAELNTHLNAEIHIRSENIELSPFRHFPYTSLSFKDFTILEPGKKQTFAKVGQLSFLFNPIDLWRGHYKIHRIQFSDADVNLRIDRQGKPNYLIWKSTIE